jgi:DNA-binding PadR family transcriptional regulator
MSEAFVLCLVERYPHPTALARRTRDGSVFALLGRLEAHGLLRRQHDRYSLTHRGRSELAITRGLVGLVIRES